MILLTYGELEIQSPVLSPSDKRIVQGLFNVDLTILDYIFISNSLQEFVNNTRKQQAYLEFELKKLESDLEEGDNLRKYESLKNDLELIYDHIAEGVRLRSKCDWYEQGEKSTKFFLNLEKQRDNQNRIRKLIVNEKEINNETEILNQIKLFYETLFQKPSQKDSADDVNHFLNTLDIPKLSTDQIFRCDILCDSMKSMENDKSPGNDGLTKEFYVTFWDDIKATFICSLKQAKEGKKLSIYQRQTIIKLTEKRTKIRDT